MTARKLNNFIEKAYVLPHGPQTHTPILLSDSKLKYLLRVSRDPVEKEWYTSYEEGRTCEQGYDWIREKLDSKIERYQQVWVYVWLGTCNLTTKPKKSKYIYLTSQDNSAALNLVRYYHKINNYIQSRSAAKVTFLEIPIYSIYEFNYHNQHDNPDQFRDDDAKLRSQIYYVNGKIREINYNNRCHSPVFSTDITRTSKERSPYNTNEYIKRKKYSWWMYIDGIHPGFLLGSVWFRKITQRALRDCWEKYGDQC